MIKGLCACVSNEVKDLKNLVINVLKPFLLVQWKISLFFRIHQWATVDSPHVNNFLLIPARPIMEGARRQIQGWGHEPRGTSERVRKEHKITPTTTMEHSVTTNRGAITMLQGRDIDSHATEADRWMLNNGSSSGNAPGISTAHATIRH
jgi:hypothetical protein